MAFVINTAAVADWLAITVSESADSIINGAQLSGSYRVDNPTITQFLAAEFIVQNDLPFIIDFDAEGFSVVPGTIS